MIRHRNNLFNPTIKTILSLFLIWRSALVIIFSTSFFYVTQKTDFLGKQFEDRSLNLGIWPLANFDGEHYLWIAQNSYRQFEYAFFPLFPLIIKYFSKIVGDVLLSGLLLSNIATLFLLVILYKLFILDFKKEAVTKGIIFLLVFPTAFYLTSVYNESLFLCFTAGSLLAARKNNYKLASVLGIAACATRLVGIFLLPALFLVWFNGHSRRRYDLFLILLVPTGLLLVMLFNFMQTGDLLNFFHVQANFGANRSGSSLILLPQVIFRYLKIFITVPFLSHSFFISFQEFILTSLAFLLVAISVKKIRPEYLIFSLGVIITPTLTGTLSSMPRYLLAAFPLFFVLGDMIRNKFVVLLIILLMSILEIVNLILFSNGYWVS